MFPMLSKLISLAMCLMLAISPVTAAAAGGDVARVNGIAFSSIQAALDAAQSGESEAERTVVLLKDIDLGASITEISKGDVILDLNGKTLSGESHGIVTLNGTAKLTICDNGGGTGRMESTGTTGGAVIDIEGASCQLVIEGGTYLAPEANVSAISCAENTAEITIVGGSVRGIGC
jgi:pectin methylesterase-like acyl-CoA thioesterase